ncbi:hypothetical protein FOA52_003086 [Chlamydomonas sp. UWO 241]|nr:hypothetical protein FOA52_003086 [Chlamydomonas sp. UWO 241]
MAQADSSYYPDEGRAGQREIGNVASWSVSSAKTGNGVESLRDGRRDTFWQSDGSQPHFINIQFQRKVELTELHIFLDFKSDESYTPNKVSIRAGTAVHDLQEVRVVELEEPTGCIRVPLCGGAGASPSGGGPEEEDAPEGRDPLCAFFLQIAVLSNHQNGRDTHIRLVRVYGPRADPAPLAALALPCAITTPAFGMYTAIR